LRYRKAFRRNTSTELEIRGARPESWTGDEAHARVRQLLEQHLDTALWRALERSACAVENGSESTLYGVVRDEFGRYFTEKRADPRKILREARADEQNAAAEVERIEGQLEDLEGHVE